MRAQEDTYFACVELWQAQDGGNARSRIKTHTHTHTHTCRHRAEVDNSSSSFISFVYLVCPR